MFVALSGGKDSTAMALLLSEQGIPFRCLYTPTGNELPQVREHIDRVVDYCGSTLVVPPGPTLAGLIEEQRAIPNWRMRWCTRMIKIEPCKAYLDSQNDAILAVGLRADEPGRAGGTYEATIIYPLQSACYGLLDVLETCRRHDMKPPPRTDCAVCFYQTLHEWYLLWLNHRDQFNQGIGWEHMTGHTFRSPKRDTQPAALADLAYKFELGYVPKKRARKVSCRVCSM